MKTLMQKKENLKRQWYLVDAKNKVLGRLAAKVARMLMGKNKVSYTPYVDGGDEIIVINAAGVALTGKKFSKKVYYKHTGYPGGLKEKTLKEFMETKPEEVIRKAVKGMLPKNKLASRMIKRLKVYKDASHPHQAQNPEIIKI
jgi:large subunit ribosomal protein L13